MHRTSNATTGRALAAAAVIALALTSCGKAAEKLAEKGIEQAIENESGGDVNVDLDSDGGFVFESDEGSVRVGEDGSFVVEGEDGEVFTGGADDEGFTITGDDGESVFRSFEGIPDEWPADVPQPAGLVELSGTLQTTPGSFHINTIGTPPGSAADYLNAYVALLDSAGYERTSFYEADDVVQMVYENATWSVAMFSNDNGDPIVSVSIINAPD